jgi:antitoxin (DNA-binding transcriptional repressor) of toxin-antitoxin stability system
MSDLAVENTPAVAEPARKAADGDVVYITDRGERLAAIIPADLAAALERLSAIELEEMSAGAAHAGHERLAELLEDLADRAAAREARASIDAGESVIPWEQVKTEAGL